MSDSELELAEGWVYAQEVWCHHVNGKLHRENGPACIFFDNSVSWWWEGRLFNPNNFDENWPDAKKAWWMRAVMGVRNAKTL